MTSICNFNRGSGLNRKTGKNSQFAGWSSPDIEVSRRPPVLGQTGSLTPRNGVGTGAGAADLIDGKCPEVWTGLSLPAGWGGETQPCRRGSGCRLFGSRPEMRTASASGLLPRPSRSRTAPGWRRCHPGRGFLSSPARQNRAARRHRPRSASLPRLPGRLSAPPYQDVDAIPGRPASARVAAPWRDRVQPGKGARSVAGTEEWITSTCGLDASGDTEAKSSPVS